MDHYSSFYYNLFWNMQGVGVQVRPHKKIHVLVFQSTIVRLSNLTKIICRTSLSTVLSVSNTRHFQFLSLALLNTW